MRAIISVNSRKGVTQRTSLSFMESFFHQMISRMTAGRVQVAVLLSKAIRNEVIDRI